MTATFTTKTEWFLAYRDVYKQEGGDMPAGAPHVADVGKQWVRWVDLAETYRYGTGQIAYVSSASETKEGTLIPYQHGDEIGMLEPGRTYTCIRNPIRPTIEASGMWIETLEWFSAGYWEQEDLPIYPLS